MKTRRLAAILGIWVLGYLGILNAAPVRPYIQVLADTNGNLATPTNLFKSNLLPGTNVLFLTNAGGGLTVHARGQTNATLAAIALTGAITNITAGSNATVQIANGLATVNAAYAAGSGILISGSTISLYVAPTISSFINDQNIVEQGATVTSTILDWTLSGGAITSQSLNQGIGSLAIGLRTYTDPAAYTTNRTYTLTGGDGTSTVQASTTVSVQSKAYWGPSSDPTPDDATLLAMSQEFATGLARTKSVTVNGEHIVFAYPAAFGLSSFRVNGFTDTAWTLEVRNVVNASGATVSYNVYHSNEPGLGTFTVELYVP